MKTKYIIFTALMLFFSVFATAQDNKNWSFYVNGYVNNMQSVMFDSLAGNWTNDNLIHNRINFNAYYKQSVEIGVSVRNRLFTGETVKNFAGYADYIGTDRGFFDMSYNLVNEKSVLLNTSVDRLYFKYTKNKFELTVGRQRINWAKTFVWNPNDLFNNYSFFDVDYPERPGSDAIDMVYYWGVNSSIEFASKIDADTNLTAALRYNFALGTYDIQLIGGLLKEQDLAVGLGWTGYIKDLTFRGEATYLQPKDNIVDTSGQLVASVGFDYTLADKYTFVVEYLYSGQKQNFVPTGAMDFYSAPQDIKHLSFSEHNFMAQVMAQVTPLVTVSFAGLYFPSFDGYFLMPNLQVSMAENLDLTIIPQFFKGTFDIPVLGKTDIKFTAVYLRMSYNFGN